MKIKEAIETLEYLGFEVDKYLEIQSGVYVYRVGLRVKNPKAGFRDLLYMHSDYMSANQLKKVTDILVDQSKNRLFNTGVIK